MTRLNDIHYDLNAGLPPAECVKQLLTYLDAWGAMIEARLDCLEAAVQADRQNLEDVDSSLRQTWQALDAKLNALDERLRTLEGS